MSWANLYRMKGILNLNKEAGMTSAGAIARARRILGERTIGHFGTLDPQGTGVLLSGVGKAARLFDFFLTKDKVYEAEFAFGYTTDTLDPEGEITATTSVIPDQNSILTALDSFCGTIAQVPPQYSAKSVGGVRAYAAARSGKKIELAPAMVTVYSFTLLCQTAPNTYKFRIHCSKGTYIRSLCRDLADALNSLACMTSIHRTRAGEFTVESAVTLQQLEAQRESALVPLDVALKGVPRRDFADSDYQRILSGIKIDSPPADEVFTVYCKNELFGLGNSVDGKLKITTFLKD